MADNTHRGAAPDAIRGLGLLVSCCVAVFACICLLLLFAGLHRNDGHLVLSLDDPYIHLALAEQIAHGHYGINPGQPSSPSSSVLWPLLLVPFWRSGVAPLLLNFAAGVLAAALLARIALEALPELNRRVWAFVAAAALIAVCNLPGLVFLGMEHTLQVLIAVACAFGVLRSMRDEPVPAWVLVAAVLGPAVRYELVAMTFAVAAALFARGHRRKGIAVLGASLVPLLLFAAFLHHLGLPPLPLSVLVKGREAAGGTGQVRSLLLATLAHERRSRLLVLALTAGLSALAVRERGARRWALAAAALATLLQVLVGRFGWMHRYEVYAVAFGALVVLGATRDLAPRPRTWALALLALWGVAQASIYLRGWTEIPKAANEVYAQQFQAQRFLREYYPADFVTTGSVAVNDLGLVSWRRPAGLEIIDLWGLGSLEAARQKNKNPAWLAAMAREHNVRLAIVYRQWFGGVPPGWTPLGAVCLAHPERRVMVSEDCAAYFAVQPGDAPALQSAAAAFAKTLPASSVWQAPAR